METLTCKRCGEEYEPEYIGLLGAKVLRGDGNCVACRKIIMEELEAKERAAFLRDIKDRRDTIVKQSGIPAKFLTTTFDTFDKGWQDKALATCLEYADGFPIDQRPIDYPSLYLWSLNSWGVGKTHLSCAIANSILYRWTGEGNKGCPRVYFISESDLFRQIQATFSYSREESQTQESEGDIIKRLIYCDLLILDDVGKEKRSNPEFLQRTLFGLIDGRYKLQLPMILTANVDADGLKRHLEGASLDRFFEMTGGKAYCMNGESYRRKK